jgi:DNA repair photolyase
MTYHYADYKTILSPKNGMNIYRGCTHGCIYCDSRNYPMAPPIPTTPGVFAIAKKSAEVYNKIKSLQKYTRQQKVYRSIHCKKSIKGEQYGKPIQPLVWQNS